MDKLEIGKSKETLIKEKVATTTNEKLDKILDMLQLVLDMLRMVK
jgi:hypothetical protein